MRITKDCTECRLTAHRGRCAFCGGTGSIPLRPPVSETVVVAEVRKNQDGEEGVQTLPFIVMRSKRIAGEKGRAVVVLSGWLVVNPPLGARPMEFRPRVEGPSSKIGCWNWRGDPS